MSEEKRFSGEKETIKEKFERLKNNVFGNSPRAAEGVYGPPSYFGLSGDNGPGINKPISAGEASEAEKNTERECEADGE